MTEILFHNVIELQTVMTFLIRLDYLRYSYQEFEYTVHNGYSDNGGDMEFLAKVSLYPMYITKFIVTTSNIFYCIHCQYIYFHKYNQISYRIQLVTIFMNNVGQ